jgi:aminopeptidase N
MTARMTGGATARTTNRTVAGRPAAGVIATVLFATLAALGSRSAGAQAQPSGARATAAAALDPHPYRPGIDVVDYDLTLDLPDSGRTIRGLAVLAVRRTAPVDTLVLDLLHLRVDSVWVGGRLARFRRDSATVRVPLPPASPATSRGASAGAGGPVGAPPQRQDSASSGPAPHQSSAARGAATPAQTESLTVAVRYGGEVRDGLIISTDAQGRWVAFGDNWPNRARNWIPSVDHPSDKATVTWRVRAPSERRVVANGALLEETPLAIPAGRASGAGGRRQPLARTLTRWRESRPIPVYLMVVAAAPLAHYDLGPAACGRAELPGCVRQSVYVAPEVRDFLPGPFAAATDILDFFSRLVAPFPYEKLAHVQSATRFGGMENASVIFYADRPFRDRTMGRGVIAHEIAHQWFGDAVTEREWGHLWLSEGFASYFEQLWVRHSAGDTAFRREMATLRTEILASPVTTTRPVLDTAETDYLKLLNTNSYQKGAWVLHMLRATVGDSAFVRGVRRYYLKYRHGTALTDDLRREMEAESGRDLGWFFAQWLQRPGVAEVSIDWRFDPGVGRVTLDVRQEGRFGAYRFPLTVDVVDSTGTVRRTTVEVPAERQSQLALPLTLGGAPARLLFDPDVEVLARIPAAGRGA